MIDRESENVSKERMNEWMMEGRKGGMKEGRKEEREKWSKGRGKEDIRANSANKMMEAWKEEKKTHLPKAIAIRTCACTVTPARIVAAATS